MNDDPFFLNYLMANMEREIERQRADARRSRWRALSAGTINGGAWLHIGPLRLRWKDRGFRPLYSERYGHIRWHSLGRFGWRWVGRR